MKRREREEIAGQIVDQASEWFVAMREPSVGSEEREAFAEWLRASPVHVRAYLDVARLWGDAAAIAADVETDPEKLIGAAANVVPIREGTAGEARVTADVQRASARRWLAVAACALVACGVAGYTAWWEFWRVPSFVADVGEQRVITLDDGSTIRLNSRSEVNVKLLPRLREVELVAGQALFEVARDPSRPFVVRSGSVAVRAVGTAFDVYRKDTGTVVTVVEGVVEIRRAGRADVELQSVTVTDLAAVRVTLAAGEQATVSGSGEVSRKPHVDVAAATSWLQQELVFNGERLADVVAEFNRYLRTPIVLEDARLAGERVNAVFHTTSPESLLKFVSRFEGVKVERSEEEIVISRRPRE